MVAADQHDRQLADVMAEVARTLHEPESVDDVLGRLVRVARDAIPAEFVGVSIASPKGIHTAAASDPLVNNLDQAQYELSEGPCLDAMRHHTATAVADLRTDDRWPRFGPRAVAAGVISQMGIEIFRQRSTVGGLNLYASRANAFDDDTRHAAALFARHAGLALDKSLTITNLTEALQTRQTIGQAIGIMMQRYSVDEAQAFKHLVRLSQTANIKLRDIARGVVDDLTRQAARNGKRPE
ncbi:MAG TPA: GAF and ANTAR domain-containing protein [Propionibacteriaceae bacterium]|nr:GAF and ANTAR domain-containing protein [Propionibacteriaceae bacterium]